LRLHLGHHFYGAGNLGDDFMLAGFLGALRTLAPGATCTCCVPFDLTPLRDRFPEIEWLPCDVESRARAIAASDAWIGLGGSPFQNALSRWFVDHLLGDADLCAAHRKPMLYLGVGVQTTTELDLPDTRALLRRASGIWTRDPASAARLAALPAAPPVTAGADLSHLFFAATPPPAAVTGRLAFVTNFDYGSWPGQPHALACARALPASDRVWLAQESRPLPGAELALHAALPPPERTRWRLVSPEIPGAPLAAVLAAWPSAAWLVTSRFHAAITGAWAGSRVLVVTTNEKLRGLAADLALPTLAPDADAPSTAAAFAALAPSAGLAASPASTLPSAGAPARLAALARQAHDAVAACLAAARSAVAAPR
jgi:hypothetical protein